LVFVLNYKKKPVDMCSNAEARILLKKGYAVVHKAHPFTIRLKRDADYSQETEKEYKLKIDPGSKHTGVAIVDDEDSVVFLGEIEHRGSQIVALLETRSNVRRNRRSRKTRYRRCKFVNYYLKKDSKYKADSNRPKGWFPPSIESIKNNIVNFLKKYKKLCNITSVSIESVKFDSQLLENPDISGVMYQQGTLFSYELREYLLDKYGHNCQYCSGESKDTRLEIEHKVPKSRGGSNRVDNLTIACRSCNQDKSNLTLEKYLNRLKNAKSKNKLTQKRINNITDILDKGTIHKHQRYSAWVNSYRLKLIEEIKPLVNDVELSTGGRTKYNRTNLNLPKTHYYDALCVGEVPENFNFKTDKVLEIKAYGRGSRFRGRTNSCGIITRNLPRQKNFFGFQTGDIVKANVVKGKKAGSYYGRVAIRSSGYFNIQEKNKTTQGIKYTDCKIVQRSDGYGYNLKDVYVLKKV